MPIDALKSCCVNEKTIPQYSIVPAIGLVVAAGQSKRFGSDKRQAILNKPELEAAFELGKADNGAQTLLGHSICTIAPCVSEVFIAMRANERLEDFVLNFSCEPIFHQAKVISITPADEYFQKDGIGSSIAYATHKILLACASGAVERKINGLWLMLADVPAVDPKTIALLSQRVALLKHCYGDHGIENKIVAPRYRGRHGHPVFFGRHWLQALSDLQGDEGAKGMMKRYHRQVVYVEVDDPNIHSDVDTKDDLRYIQLLKR